MTKQKLISWWLPFFFITLFAYFLQTNFLIHGDVIYLTNAAKLLLQGGTYTQDFFETNPPLIFYLYMPAIFLAKITSVDIVTLLRIYIFCLVIVSIITCNYLLTQLLAQAPRAPLIILYMLVFVLLFLPIHELGQREHFLMIFSMPYLFAAMLRLTNKPISPSLALAIGLFAGLGFALKPFFLAVPILLEAYFIYAKRNFFGWIRLESLLILAVLCLYLIHVLYTYPDYIQLILPLVSRVYFIGMASPWEQLFTHWQMLFCLEAGVIYFFLRKSMHYSQLHRILFIGLIGFVLACLLPHTFFYYQMMPAVGLASLLLASLIAEIYAQGTNRYRDNIFLVIIAGIFLATPIYMVVSHSLLAIKSQQDPYKEKLFTFFNTTSPPPTFICLSNSSDCVLMAFYSKAQYVGRFSFFWWEKGILKLQKSLQSPTALKQLAQDEALLIDSVADDLARKKPHYVLLDTTATKNELHFQLNYIDQFAKNKNFRAAWRHYHYLTTIGCFQIFARKE